MDALWKGNEEAASMLISDLLFQTISVTVQHHVLHSYERHSPMHRPRHSGAVALSNPGVFDSFSVKNTLRAMPY